MSQQLTTFSIPIPYKRAGNVIMQQPVDFDLFREDDHYKLVPHLDADGLRIANLPTELLFRVENGRAVSLRGIKDSNLHVMQDAVRLAQEQQSVLT